MSTIEWITLYYVRESIRIYLGSIQLHNVTGYIVGNAGLLVTLTQFIIAYGILVFTVASVCAISTNGAVEGGGAYCILQKQSFFNNY